MTSKLDRLMILQEEVLIAKKFVEEHGPEDMGYVNTAINSIEERILDWRLEINKNLDA